MAGGAMTRPSRIQKVLARPPVGKQRAGLRPSPPKENSVNKDLTGRQPAAAPKDPVLQARQDAVAAEAEVAKISRTHLGTLMASPPRQRMAHLTDPELTPADRTELEHSVRSALPRSAPVKAPLSTLAAYPRRLLRACGYKCAVATVVLTVGGLLAGMAWHNTGERIVASGYTWIIDWHLPDGSIWHGAWNAGIPAIAMRPHDGMVILRYWLNGRGYATTEVDETWLLRNSFDYVVGPTGGVGVVSPSSR
jgi:hypothetical protein